MPEPILENIKSIVAELDEGDEPEDFHLVEEEDFKELVVEAEDAQPPEFKVEEADPPEDTKPTTAEDEEDPPLRPDLEALMDIVDNPLKTKKSFEVKVQNDDDDEIFIVHDAEEEDQDSLFV